MIRNSIKIIFSILILASCSSFELQIASEPSQADVYIKEGQQLKKVGQTPMQLTQRDIAGKQNFQISIQKEGYVSQDVLMQGRSLSARGEIHATLEKKADSAGAQQESSKNIQKSQRQIASIQAQILQNNYQQAEVLTRSFLDSHPYSAVGWSLLGNAYLLQNRNQDALQAYSKALEFDPDNQETQNVIRYLRVEPQRRER